MLLLVLMIFLGTVEAGWVSKEQYKKLIVKQDYLDKRVKELGLPKEVVDIFLGMYLRESSIGLYSVGDKEKDKYYYIHQNERIYVTEKIYLEAKYTKDKTSKYIKAEYWGKKWVKKLYVSVGEIKPISEASLGDYNITFPAIVVVIRKYKLKQYYWYLNKSRTEVIRKIELVNKVLNDRKFNTNIALLYFKMNYDEAVRRKMNNPVERATSRHNGGWYNFRYIKKIGNDTAYVKDALSLNEWNINKKEYLRNI